MSTLALTAIHDELHCIRNVYFGYTSLVWTWRVQVSEQKVNKKTKYTLYILISKTNYCSFNNQCLEIVPELYADTWVKLLCTVYGGYFTEFIVELLFIKIKQCR